MKKTKNIEAIYPLSPMQQGMLFHSIYAPNSGTYFEQMVFNLKGNVNVVAFESAWQKVVDRYSILRTLFIWENRPTPLQVVLKQATLPWNNLDWGSLSPTQQQQQLSDLLLREREQGFPFSQVPLMRCTFIKLNDETYKFIWSFHHILLDGWSLPIIFQEVFSFYEAERSGKTCYLPTPDPYRDYIAWLNSQNTEAANEFWQQTLQGFSAPTPFGVDKTKPPHQQTDSHYGEFELRLRAEVSRGLQNIATQNNLTLSTIVQGVWALLLSHYSGEKDVVFGVTVSGRTADLPGIEKMVGLFINTLPLLVRISPSEKLIPWLEQIQQSMFKLQDYSYTPLFEIQAKSEVPGGIPLFESLVVFENYPVGKNGFNEEVSLQLSEVKWFEKTNYPLTIIAASGDEFLVKLIYDTDRFEEDTIKRMMGHLQTIFSAIVANPQQTVSKLPLLTEAERHQLLVGWNETQKSKYPQDKWIHQLFEKQVELTPDAVAVVFEEQQLTYQQLNTRANQLAHYLQSQGVKPEVLVGICVERSVEMVVGLLGILKAGGAYVPLDPKYPTERLSYMLEDSGVEVLLTQQFLLSSLPSSTAQVVCLDRDWEIISQQNQINLETDVSSDNLAYVIYTSGSTGQPKGVLVEHQNVVRLFAATQSWYNFNQHDVWTNFHSIAFDFSVWEIWGALIYGGRLVVVPYWISREPENFHNLLCGEKVTILNQTPSAFRQLISVEEFEPEKSKLSLRLVIFGGEALELQSLKPWFDQHGEENPQLVNMYGITETTVHVTYRPLTINDLKSSGSLIGRPIPDLEMYILNDNLQPVPIGVTGQMYVGGDGLARGYLNRPELTNQRFISNPFQGSSDLGSLRWGEIEEQVLNSNRLYKTGDLARYLPNGEIEYQGRIDNQVKIRGFRIELGEIEAALNNHPQVQQAVVIVREDIPGNKGLVAYVVTYDDSINSNQLRVDLKQKLPEYMVPSAFVLLETIPLTPNGKIDRKALPSPDGEITRTNEYIAPRTEIELILSQIWQESLLKEKVGINDNFFALGGDSILSIQVVSRAKNAGIQVTPRQIFQNQTIAELARVANTTIGVNAQQGIVTGTAPLTPIQQWFFAQNHLEAHHHNQSFLLRLTQNLSNERLALALKKLLLHHDALRLRFTSLAAEYPPIDSRQEESVPLDLVDLSLTPPQEQAKELQKIATVYQASLNLSAGPIMRVVVFNLGQDEQRLLVIIHHLAVDGVSWRIIISDLATIYQQIEAQQPVKLSAKTTAFKDWAMKLKEYAQSEILFLELDYWLNQPWSEATSLPLDYAQNQGENTVSSAAAVSVKLNVEDTRTLLGSVNAAYNTQINDILLSALIKVLAEWTGNATVLIDLEGHGREDLFEDVDLSRTVGWFTTIFPVLLKIPEIRQLASVIKSIKEQLRAIPKRGIGYGILKYLCEDNTVQEKIQRIPHPEISFNYLGQFDQIQAENGWSLDIESTGANQSPRQNRDHLLDINALVIEGELQISWTYSRQVHNRTTVENLAQNYIQAIRTLIEHCQSDEAFGYTPSDFPDASLNQQKIDELLGLLGNPKIESIYPLSPLQKGMLFHSVYAPSSGVYFEQMVFNLKGDVNVVAFESAWQKVVDRYSVFRTLFVWENHPTPLQVVLKQVALPWTNLDWSSLPPTEQQQQLSEFLLREREQGFDFNQAPLMKCTLIKHSDETYRFIWSHHHILIDGWSLPIIFQEVFSFYEAERTGKTSCLPTPVPYGNYIAWLNSQNTEAAIEFWQQNLQGFSAPTPFGVDKAKSPHQQTDSHYSEFEFRLSAEISRGLQNVANQNHLTLSTIVQGVWALLLSRYSGEENVVFGVTVSGRTADLSGIEKMVGLFINTLPLLVRISPSEQLIPWLEQIQQSMLKLQDYSYTPLFEIQAKSEVPGGIPLFESLVVFENYPVEKTGFNEEGSLQLGKTDGFEQTNYPLTVAVVPWDELFVKISYDTDRFEEETIKRMMGHLQTMFCAIVANPQQTVAQLPLLSEAERHQLLVEWNNTHSEYPKDKCIHQLFESQVARTPDAVAVVYEQQQLTYQQLNTQANQLAHYLQSQGVRLSVLVGICIERSVEMVVGLLGILKAGGTYVPLDPNYPAERLSYMLDDSGVEVLLAQQKLLSSLPSSTAQVVCLDRDSVIIEQQSQANLDTEAGSDNLAYVIYTSGSTGKPKGVAIPHRGISRLVLNTDYIQLNANDRVAQVSNTSFDAATFEIWGALLNGCQLVGIAQDILLSPQEFALQLCDKHISVGFLTTALFNQLARNIPDAFKNLRYLLFGGEAVEPRWVRQILKNTDCSRLLHVYGPTESTTFASFYWVQDVKEGATTLPIGRPIANTQIYILDKHLQPVPVGVLGELYIGGDGLAKGYFNRPELTSEKFIPNPFKGNSEVGEKTETACLTPLCDRLYKTGDLGRYLPDGNIEFLGRFDNQVKIRGFRIELGEIEAVLNNHPQIQLAVVIVREDIPQNKRLVAYVVAGHESLNNNQLREDIKQKLPEYMVPSAFVLLETLPLTPNGKIDRKALPSPDGEISRTDEYIAPRTEVELILSQIWQELLLKEKVGIHDNFFNLGGDSILSIQVVSHAKNAGIQITPRQIFQNQTIAELARVANTTVGVNAQQGIVTGTAPLTPIQHWFFAQNHLEAHHYNQSFLLRQTQNLSNESLALALKKLLSHHDALRLRFTSLAAEYLPISPSEDQKLLTVVDLSSTPGQEQAEALTKIATVYQASLNLSNGPIMRVVMFNLGGGESRLLIIIHHLAVDGVSWRIIISDLATIYRQIEAQQPIKLNAKTTAFKDWALKLNKYAQSEILQQELDYWLNQSWSDATSLPLDYAQTQGENTVSSAAAVSVNLNVENTRTLLGSVNAAYNTQINDILLSALVKVLAEWTGNATVLIDLEGHGREDLFEDVDLSRTVGWFTSIFPVLLKIPEISQSASVIKSIKEQLRAIPKRGIGYGILKYLCEDTTVQEQIQRTPHPEISFNYLGQFDQIQAENEWLFATESTGLNQSPRQNRDHLLDINALVIEGELQIGWTYSSQVHSRATVENLAQNYIQAIRTLIEHCQSDEAFGYTPSDFPDASLTQQKIDELLGLLGNPKIESIYPLSPLQQGMLFHSIYAPSSGVYFEQMTLSLKGDINEAALQESWQKVVDRYSILRTLFVWENRPTPLQVVLKQVALPWTNLDWSSLPPAEQQQQLSEFLLREREQGFDFNQAPLMKCTLIKLNDETYKFIWSFHHILIDGWSLPIIYKEVFSFYHAQRTGETSCLETPVPYRDYIAWLNSQNTEAAIEFWQQTLQGFSAPTPFGVDKTKSHRQQTDSHYSEFEFRLSAEISRGLQNVANQNHLTLSTIVQGVWALLLSRYSGEENVVFGVTVSGRTADLSGIEKMVGLLINTLPLLVRISPSEQLIPWLEQIQQSMLKLQDYSYTPLFEIQANSEVPGGIPLFESLVVFENYPVEKTEFNEESSLQLGETHGFEQTNYPLTVVVVPWDELFVKISYDTDRFEEETIKRMMGHLQTMFCAIVANPQQTVAQLPLLSEAERHQLLVEWNNTHSEYPKDKCIHQLFESQVARTPDAVAVVYEQQQLTYQQLNTQANQLAHYLQSQGVRLSVLVGICIERSVEMVVGLLGILKAGGTYVPLDPNYPAERLSYMLDDSGVEVLLAQQKLLSSLPSSTAQVVCLDRDSVIIEQQSQANLDTEAGSDNLAYVIYTSGSTGKPKGVAIPHRGISRLVLNTDYIQLNANDRVAQVSNTSFDAATFEIWGALLNGCQLVGIAQDILLSPQEFALQLCDKHISVGFLTTALFNQLARNIPDAFKNLRYLLFGGEAVEPRWVRQILKNTDCSRLLHVYGPTESTTFACFYWVQDVKEGATTLPIGRPIANTQIYILDKHLQPVPVGVLGELYIGGDGLAKGYFNRPELTSEKFIPNPFKGNSEVGEKTETACLTPLCDRLYKTGDLGRYLPDGNIEFLGRFDNQVKIRGFRIELGEIEAVLNNHPQIQLAVVIVREDIPQNKRLVAYVVAGHESLNNNQLREDIKQKLPEYMVPSAFVLLETLPLTPNGKIDRKALPSPDGEISRTDEYIAPRTEVELILSQIWQELLLKEKVGIHDNFFNLGGDSILSIQVVSHAKNAGIQITPRQIFQNQTIAELARVANTTVGVNAQQGIVTGTAPLTPIQHWFFAQNHLEAHHYNQSFLLRQTQNLSNESLALALKKLLSHHDALRLRFTSLAAEYLPISPSEDQKLLTVVDLSSTPGQEQAEALTKIATVYQASLNLSNGPIMRVVMFNLGGGESRLLIIIHHLAVDGVSWRIIISDLATIYRQIEAQQPIKLNAKTTAFKDWALKLNKYAQSEILQQELDYWLNQSWSDATSLPLDYAQNQGENTVSSAAAVSVNLNVENTRTLLGSVNAAYNTQINDILLSALVKVLAEWTGNATVLIDLEGHGREDLFEDVDLSRTVGWFTSIFPVLLKIPEIRQSASVIKSIKEQLRAIPKRGIGYGILKYLCEDTTVQEQIQRTPHPEISFNYLGQFDQIQAENEWSLDIKSTGANQSPRQNRDHLLDINALVIEGELQIGWTYSSQVHSRATVENLAQNYIQAIRTLIEHCQSDEAFGYTPSDFPDASLTQQKIDELLGLLGNPKIESIYPLSPLQQGMLFHSIYAPSSGVYFEQMTLSLKGDINEAALQESWQKVVDRYSILRTLFVWENRPTPLQVVLKQVALPWTNLDWSSLPPAEQQQQLSEFLLREREQGFDFNQAPLMKCTLIKLNDETYKFIWSFHHILIDGWSLPIIYKEVFSFYHAQRTGETSCLETPVPYRDYIAWLNSQNTEAAIEFWQQTLQGFSAPTPFGVDKTKSHRQQTDSHYSEFEFRLSAEISRGLQNVANQNHLTLSTIVQGVWALLLSRYSGEENVVFGVTVSGRTADLSGIEKMVGLLINTLPLLVRISPSEQLIPWLEQIQQSMLKLQDYSYTPLFEIQANSEVPGGIPLFESLVVFENYPVEKTEFNEESSLQLGETHGFEQTNYPLAVVVVPGNELFVRISYDTDRFEEETIKRMMGHLQTMFCAIVAHPQQTVAQLPLLSEAERHQLLVEWNNTHSEYPKDKCIHQLFEEQVARTPDAVAIAFKDQRLTYRDLNCRANQLAHYLQSLGVGADVLVGICVERSLEMLVGLLGILKAGGAYVPLDPEYPTERLHFMLQDAQVKVLLTQQHLVDKLLEYRDKLICLDEVWKEILQNKQDNPTKVVTASHLANVIYTSGSTGKPKGVMVEHRGLCNLAQAQIQTLNLHSDSRILQFASFSFDASIWEILMAFGSGATLYLGTKDSLAPGTPLIERLSDDGITHITLPPSALAVLPVEELPALQAIIVAGEACAFDLMLEWSAHRNFFNAYGPTEASVCATITKCTPNDQKISIGRPISNAQVYILDQNLQPVPIGVPGELHIGGAGLARGYLNRPELTQEKFIFNPFKGRSEQGAGGARGQKIPPIPHFSTPLASTLETKATQSLLLTPHSLTPLFDRLYKTGDLARYLPDGNIEYLGRIDNQVKIRGFRIELGEIEEVLNNHPQVQQVVVIVTEDIPDNKRLVAYVVTQDTSLSASQLKADLKQKLPEYMVPSAFVFLESLPVTPNGKIDRKALPFPDGELTRTDEYIAPRTQSEEIIANIFASVLGVPKVGIHDNFFNLGGHSLLATQLISRLKETFQIKIPLRIIFEFPTVAELDQKLTQLHTIIDALTSDRQNVEENSEVKIQEIEF